MTTEKFIKNKTVLITLISACIIVIISLDIKIKKRIIINKKMGRCDDVKSKFYNQR